MKKLLKIPYKAIRKILSLLGYNLSITKIESETSISKEIEYRIGNLHHQLSSLYYSKYPKDSLDNKRFYNIGSGSQRSNFPYWTYVALPSDSYGRNHMDIPFDLEELKPLPLEDNSAEIIYNSFLLEHIPWEATQNLIKEAYRVLKPGGIFYSRVHCYDYGARLLKHGIISPKFFYSRETQKLLREFLSANYTNIDFEKGAYLKDDQYIIESKTGDMFSISVLDCFLSYNVTSLSRFTFDHPNFDKELDLSQSPKELYDYFKPFILDDFQKKHPHTHNANYVNAEMIIQESLSQGFSLAYKTEVNQSISPVLWEPVFQRSHDGFSFGVEAVK